MSCRRFLAVLLATVVASAISPNANALGGQSPDFQSGGFRFDNFEDEYGLGYVPDTVSVRLVHRAPLSDTLTVVSSIYDADMTGTFRLGLMRLHLDGSLDTAFETGFGVGGLAMNGYPGRGDRFYAGDALYDEASGRIVEAGSVKNAGNPAEFDTVVCRLNASSTWDPSWADDASPPGCRRLPQLSDGSSPQFAYLAADGSGGVYAAAQVGTVVRIQHLDANGDIDSAYGLAGVFTAQAPAAVLTTLSDLTVDSSGRLIVLGDTTPADDGNGSNFDWYVLRVTSDGAEDQTFGSLNGYRKIGFDLGGVANRYDWSSRVIEAASGELIVIGNAQTGSSSFGVGVVKLSTDGVSIDQTYGTANTTTFEYTQVSTSSNASTGVLLPDGGLMIAGNHELNFDDQDRDPALLVLDDQGALDTRFWNSGVKVFPIDRTSAPETSGRDFWQALQADAELERVILGGRAEGGTDDDWQGMLTGIALHDRLFKDGLEDE